MGTIRSYRGIYKAGLKYISQFFSVKEEPQTIEIGLPTDVKHVAHIGFDGPSTSGGTGPTGVGPSWMTEFNRRPDFATSIASPSGNDHEVTLKLCSSDTGKSRRSVKVANSDQKMMKDVEGSNDNYVPTVSKKQRRKKKKRSRRSKPTSTLQLESNKLDL